MAQFVPLSAVHIHDNLWSQVQEKLLKVTLPYQWEILNDRVENAPKSHCIENFRIAAGLSNGKYYGMVFQDSDLYKWLEAAAYALTIQKDEKLEKLCDEMVDLIAATQMDDGYLHTYHQMMGIDKRWSNLRDAHELYCGGHMIEAAVAYYEATGKVKILDVAKKFADLVDQVFRIEGREGYPGHPEIELALIKLFKVTGSDRYLLLSKHFIDVRGQEEDFFIKEHQRTEKAYICEDIKDFESDYFQSHQPVRDQKRATGHAVRAMYLYCAMADVARITHDDDLQKACDSLYENVVTKQMHVTGSIGSSAIGERFTFDYDLPPHSVYGETCASIGLMQFSNRMWLMDNKAQYFDTWERALYNTALASMGEDGRHFFYVNPLEVVPETVHHNLTLSHVKTQRQEWFGVACCPPNLARTLFSLGRNIYAAGENVFYILTHIGSAFDYDGMRGTLKRDDDVFTLTVEGNAKEIWLRVPENYKMEINSFSRQEDNWIIISHSGGKGTYHYCLKPETLVLSAHPNVSALAGKLCIQRGETVYCVEEAENHAPLSSLRMVRDAKITEQIGANGEVLLKVDGFYLETSQELYHKQTPKEKPCILTFTPYRIWGNRGEGEMQVWVQKKSGN